MHSLRIAHPFRGRVILCFFLYGLRQSFVEERIEEMSLIS